MFRALTQFPALERLLQLEIPTLVVVGDRDPLMPGRRRMQRVASQTDDLVLLVTIEGAAHAINFSHPGELAHVIRLFMADEPIVTTRRARARAPLRDPSGSAPPAGTTQAARSRRTWCRWWDSNPHALSGKAF